jgi:hypothetical protein
LRTPVYFAAKLFEAVAYFIIKPAGKKPTRRDDVTRDAGTASIATIRIRVENGRNIAFATFKLLKEARSRAASMGLPVKSSRRDIR